MFDTDGQPDQFRRQSRVTLLFFAELRVTCARWMERKALGIAHVGEMRKEAEFFDEPLASRLASLNPENDHAPEPVAQHTASRGMGGIVGQPRVADPRHFRVLLEMIGDLQRIGAVPLHAQRQGFQPLQDHPRIVRRNAGPKIPQGDQPHPRDERRIPFRQIISPSQVMITGIGLDVQRETAVRPVKCAAVHDDAAESRAVPPKPFRQ